MAYCPHCGVEYREGTAQCMDCRIPLKPGLPPENFKERAKKDEHPQLTRIRIFSGPTEVMEADLARNLLEAEGIPCILPGEYTAEMLPASNPFRFLSAKATRNKPVKFFKLTLILLRLKPLIDKAGEEPIREATARVKREPL